MADPALDNEGPIYESIRAAEKSGMLKKPWEAGSVLGDSPSLPNGDEPGVSMQEIMAQEELKSEESSMQEIMAQEELESKKSSVQEIMTQEELESKKSSVQEIMAQEEPESKRSPSPIYAQVHKLPRAPQPPQPPSPPEPEEETPPSLPERRFDVP
ncbi:PREDICTED: RNA polymerase II degradation factor 1-like [Calidris pugnax]|uniref:RNA polymerase II degradation factor 1-like n=1 Tax=Calidris pugnax TaxID=198806 RepID=UPI00071D2C99|nr:PREDICTED: RNA polymerase II degradation factor 1-like [Calidris pugnax]